MRHGAGAGAGALALASWILGVVLAAAPAGAAVVDPARTHEIVIQGLLYVPETLTVRPGDVVVWINKDPFPHTVTAAGSFDSGSIAAGKSWRFTARKVGTHPYSCTLHTTMKGTLRVE
jgi:plastocyanin